VVYLEHKNLWGLQGDVPEGECLVEIGKARIARTGKDITIVSWSATVHAAVAAAETLARDGIEAEVIDLRSLWPWDKAAVLESVARTGRLLVAHEAVQVGGFGAEVVATVAERAHGKLKAPVRRLGAPRAPIGYAPNLEDQVRVTPEQIATAAREMMRQ
jgi:pyruvate dehydrogenase E1 component beta subunit